MTYLEGAEQALVDAHHCTCVVKLAAVVGCTEESDELALREELVPVLHNLVSATDEVHVVLLQEPGYDIRAEGETNASVVFTPACDVFVGVRPEEIAEEAAVGNLCKSVSALV